MTSAAKARVERHRQRRRRRRRGDDSGKSPAQEKAEQAADADKRKADAVERRRAEVRAALEHSEGLLEWWVCSLSGTLEKQRPIRGVDPESLGVKFCAGGYGNGVAWRVEQAHAVT